MRVLFFGMEGVFSRAPLAALLDADHDVCGVVTPRPALARSRSPFGQGGSLRRLEPPQRVNELFILDQPGEKTIMGLAWDVGVPIFEVDRLKHEAVETLAQLQPDVICVACFPRLLPPSLLAVPRRGGFNVHPSLLPIHRGPEPLFWTFHDGLDQAGVTVHLLDAGADTGPIAAQSPLPLPDGIGYDEANRLLSDLGAKLLVDVLRDLDAGQLTIHQQEESRASLASVPTADDFVITPDWSARRAFNFIRGVADWGLPIILDRDGQRLVVHEALGYTDDEGPLPPLAQAGDILTVQCNPGMLTIRVRLH